MSNSKKNKWIINLLYNPIKATIIFFLFGLCFILMERITTTFFGNEYVKWIVSTAPIILGSVGLLLSVTIKKQFQEINVLKENNFLNQQNAQKLLIKSEQDKLNSFVTLFNELKEHFDMLANQSEQNIVISKKLHEKATIVNESLENYRRTREINSNLIEDTSKKNKKVNEILINIHTFTSQLEDTLNEADKIQLKNKKDINSFFDIFRTLFNNIKSLENGTTIINTILQDLDSINEKLHLLSINTAIQAEKGSDSKFKNIAVEMDRCSKKGKMIIKKGMNSIIEYNNEIEILLNIGNTIKELESMIKCNNDDFQNSFMTITTFLSCNLELLSNIEDEMTVFDNSLKTMYSLLQQQLEINNITNNEITDLIKIIKLNEREINESNVYVNLFLMRLDEEKNKYDSKYIPK